MSPPFIFCLEFGGAIAFPQICTMLLQAWEKQSFVIQNYSPKPCIDCQSAKEVKTFPYS
jgi:hypothetical protein